MDLVRNHDDAPAVAEGGEPFETLAGPCDAGRIVRVRENEHPASVVAYGLEVLKVHFIPVDGLTERIEHDLPAVSLRHEAERMIDWRLDDDLLVLLQKGVYGHSDALDDARNI